MIFDPFAALGFERRFEIEPARLEARYRELQRALHPDRHAGATATERRVSLSKAMAINEAYRTLKDELRRAEALLALQRDAVGAPERGERTERGEPADPAFLAAVMELREALGEAKEARDRDAVRALAARVAETERVEREELRRRFAALDQAPSADALVAMERVVGRLKYYRRFFDEVAAIEERSDSPPACGGSPAAGGEGGR